MTETLEVVQRPFSEVSAVVARGTGTFHARVDEAWTIGGRPNGGYLLAILGQAAASVTAHPDVIAASAHYVRPPEPGPVVVATNVLRNGRSASQVRAEMAQGGQTCVESLLTLSALDHAAEPYWDRGVPPTIEVPYEECVPLASRLPSGTRVAIMEQIEVRLEPAASGFTAGQPSGTGELRGWLDPSTGRGFRTGVAPVRRRRLSARHLRHRIGGMGPHFEHDGLRAGPPVVGPGSCHATRAPDRRATRRRVVLHLGLRRSPGRTGHPVGGHPPRLTADPMVCLRPDAVVHRDPEPAAWLLHGSSDRKISATRAFRMGHTV